MCKDRLIPVATKRRSRRKAFTPGMSSATIGAELSQDDVEFGLTIDRYKRENNRPFPTWSEVLAIVRALGYRKVAEPDLKKLHPKNVRALLKDRMPVKMS